MNCMFLSIENNQVHYDYLMYRYLKTSTQRCSFFQTNLPSISSDSIASNCTPSSTSKGDRGGICFSGRTCYKTDSVLGRADLCSYQSDSDGQTPIPTWPSMAQEWFTYPFNLHPHPFRYRLLSEFQDSMTSLSDPPNFLYCSCRKNDKRHFPFSFLKPRYWQSSGF